ncbi:glycosyltransferase 48 kDa subunit, partial [Striga asiatica]
MVHGETEESVIASIIFQVTSIQDLRKLGFSGSVDAASLLEFVDVGHDLILVVDASIAVEYMVDFDEDPAALVINHTSYAVSETEGDHTLMASGHLIQSEAILGSLKIEFSEGAVQLHQ